MRAASSVTIVGRLLIALLFVTFLIEQAPHLVHHFFDPEYTGEECSFATSGERLPGLGAEAIGFDYGPGGELLAHSPAPSLLLDVLVRGPFARAPPRPASSLA